MTDLGIQGQINDRTEDCGQINDRYGDLGADK